MRRGAKGVMKQIDGLKILLFSFSVLILLNVSKAEGQTMGIIHDWEPLRVRIDLGLPDSSDIVEQITFFNDNEFSKMRDQFEGEIGRKNLTDIKDDRYLNILQYRNVRLYLSSMVKDQVIQDIQHTSGKEIGKFDTIVSLPSLFLNSQYRESLESVGKIFEPQVSLGIEF
jgi:hypothetical protein